VAVRGDLTYLFSLSPRLIKVALPSTEVVLQDLHDTTVVAEQSVDGMDELELVSSAGKEDLGGGTQVGITSTLLDGKLLFDARTASDESGTVTTPDPTGTTLIDSAGLFITNGILPGAVIINFNDRSVGTVLTIDSEFQITLLEPMADGTLNTWVSGDFYKIWNIDQCAASGGNLVAVDDLGATTSAIFPTFGTQILLTSSSSATLQELEMIQFSSFQNRVTVDLANISGKAVSGTTFPIGTPDTPVDNWPDALAISSERGLGALHIRGDAVIDTYDFSGLLIEGDGISRTLLTINPGALVLDCEFKNADIIGTLDGNSTLLECNIGDLAFVNGTINSCVLSGIITLGGGVQAHFRNCESGIAGGNFTPTINCGGAGQALIVRDYHGGLALSNRTGVDEISIDLGSGQIIIESTVTNGDTTLRGLGKLTDNSTGSSVVHNELISSSTLNAIFAILGNRMKIDSTAKTLTIYDKDEATPLFVYDLLDALGAPSAASIFERVLQP